MNAPYRRGRADGSGALDVRAFPENTTILLVLLGLAVATVTLYVNVLLTSGDIPSCLQHVDGLAAGRFRSPAEINCVARSLHAMGAGALKRMAQPVLLGLMVYAGGSSLRLRTLKPLGASHAPQARRIRALAERTGLRRRPLVFGARRGRHTTGVGGSPRKYYVRVSNNHLAWYELGAQRRDAFDAVILHELAHLDTGDLRRYQAARAMRRLAFVYCFAALLTLPTLTDTQALLLITQMAVLAVVVELLVRAFLRAREFRADARAAAVAPEGMSYSAELAAQGKKARRGPGRLFARHPDAAHRLAALRDPASVLRFPVSHALSVGFFAGLAFSVLATVFGYLYWQPGGPVGRETSLAAMVVGAPLTVAICLGMLRHAWADLLGRRSTRTVPLIMALTCGLIVGRYVSPFFSVVADTGAGDAFWPMAVATLLMAVIAVRWPVAVAAGWFPTDEESESRRVNGDGHSGMFTVMKRIAIGVGCLLYFRIFAAWGLFGRLADSVASQVVTEPAGLPDRLDLDGLRRLVLLVLESAGGGWPAAVVLTLAWSLPLVPRLVLPTCAPRVQELRHGRRARRSGVLWAGAAWIAGLTGVFVGDELSLWAGLGMPLPNRMALVVGSMMIASALTTLRIRGPLAGPYAMAAAFTAALVGMLFHLGSEAGRHELSTALPHVLAAGQMLAALTTLVVGSVKRLSGQAASLVLATVVDEAAAAQASARSTAADPLAESVRRALNRSDPTGEQGLKAPSTVTQVAVATEPGRSPAAPEEPPVTDTVRQALDRAATLTLANTFPLSTQDLLVALMHTDGAAEWDRIWLHTRSVEHLRRHPLPDPPAARPVSRHGHLMTSACAESLKRAERIARHCATPLTSGAVTLALVSHPASAAARALGVGSVITETELLDLVQECVLGFRIENLAQLLEPS
ncbi:M48 family metalloprotease [Streptomyces aquilus]|uniref:M48 family metalloprotease n=1 Tax=Streptomyces aquilus TaxID=2548456 RepID=UPI00368EF563